MNDKWKRLTVKEDTITLSDGSPFVVKGMLYREMGKFGELQERKDYEAMLNFLLTVTLRKSMPVDGADAVSDAEIQEIVNNINAEDGSKIIQKVQELSGFRQ